MQITDKPKITDEQARSVIQAINDESIVLTRDGRDDLTPTELESAGRAAFSASERILAAEHKQQMDELAERLMMGPTEKEMMATASYDTNWVFGSGADYARVQRIFANRLAEYRKLEVDAAVEAVMALRLPTMAQSVDGFMLDRKSSATVVAAVREADRKAAQK